jgi:hypothetical protein
MQTLQFFIDCGKTTCAKEPRKFCSKMVTQQFGCRFICSLFNKELCDENNEPSGPGWLQRLPECITAQK